MAALKEELVQARDVGECDRMRAGRIFGREWRCKGGQEGVRRRGFVYKKSERGRQRIGSSQHTSVRMKHDFSDDQAASRITYGFGTLVGYPGK